MHNVQLAKAIAEVTNLINYKLSRHLILHTVNMIKKAVPCCKVTLSMYVLAAKHLLRINFWGHTPCSISIAKVNEKDF